MNQQKMGYRLYRYTGNALYAKREISYEMRLTAQMMLDELCFEWNKKQLKSAIDQSIDANDKQWFLQLSQSYRSYIWE
ncbi:hypothetical protein GCM10008983_15660 [Lentibacillus halophilus]|uniref:IDEAL domain-containing protein n=1 Tax=Lentibacillus halophilus TaxID=295065 RepID=A0ABN0Z947_9BACI